MAGRTVSRLLMVTCMGAALAGCVVPESLQNKPADENSAATTAKPATSVRLVDRDVEAPDAYQANDLALWDGRPSLGGVWVAAPDVKDPERVILRNPANGKFVIGALFRRERENPGPKLQISSDAATALGLLAGQPGKINVTALRREEGAAKTDASKPHLDAAEPIAVVGATDPKTVARDTTKAISGGAITGGAITGSPVTAQPAKSGTATAAPAAIAAPTAAANSKPASATAAPPGGAHSVQIGIFSVEANATRAADSLKKAGISASVRKGQTQGKDHWSVTATGADRAALLAKVKSAGFTDAYLLR